MLVVTRRLNECVVIGTGDDTTVVSVVESKNGRVKLGIKAPDHISIDRMEIRARKDREAADAQRNRNAS